MAENFELFALYKELVAKTEAYASDTPMTMKGEWSDCVIVNKLIKSIFIDAELGYDWDSEDLVDFYKDQFVVLTIFIERILPAFGQEGIHWVISAFTKFISNGCPTALTDELFLKIMRLHNLLESDSRRRLLSGCISAWATYRCDKNAVLKINPAQNYGYELDGYNNVRMTEIPFTVAELGEAAFIKCMISMIKASIYEIKNIPEKLGMLWMVLIKESEDIYMVSKLLTIMNMLVREKLVDPFSFLNYIDVIMSYFRFFVENPTEIIETVKSSIEMRVIEGTKLICSIISDPKSVIMKKIELVHLLQFAVDLAAIIIKRAHVYCGIFMKFINSYLTALNSKNINKPLYKDFARKCVELLKIMIMKTEQIDDGYLKNVFVFFRMVEGQEKTTIIVVNLLKDIERGSSNLLIYRLGKVIKNLSNDIITKAVNKLLTVLKLITPGDSAVEVWKTFLENIDKKIIQEYLPQMLISIAGLYGKSGCESVFKPLFDARKDSDSNSVACKRFDRAIFVFYNNDRAFMNQLPSRRFEKSELLMKCIEMLLEEGPDAQKYILEQLNEIIDEDVDDFDKAQQSIHALLYAIKTSICEETQQLIGLCLGKLGAIDPGRMGMQAVGDNRKGGVDRRDTSELKVITNPEMFFRNILSLCAKILMDCYDTEKANNVGYSIQIILKELNSPEYKSIKRKVLQSLKNDIFREIEPYNDNSLTMSITLKPKFNIKPFVNDSKNYSEWLWKWFFSASNNIRDQQFSRIFKGLQFIYCLDDIRLPQQMLPQLVIQSLVENNDKVRDEALNEIHSVFEAALSTNEGWIRLASHTCFQIIELLEKFYISMETEKRKPPYKMMVGQFLRLAIGKKIDETNLLSVAVAMKFNSSCRALRWLEEYGIKMKNNVMEFERDLLYLLERIYSQLNDTDGVLGAFETIKSFATPLPKEQVVALEATGDYTRALPLYQSPHLQKVPLVKCFMRMNQPLVAYNNAKTFVQNETGYVLNKLQDYQIEGAYKTGDWDFLNEKLKNVEGININSWGAHVAAILSQIHEKSRPTFETCMKRARKQLMESLQAVTMEDADTYSQAYRYIQRLHILFEIEDACFQFSLFDEKPSSIIADCVLETWNLRSENVIQSSGVLEPIYETRRGLLKLANPIETKEAICSYLLESCRLSIQSGHLETAWTHLVEARCLNIQNDLEIDIETARYEFGRGEQATAITTLRRSLKKHFPNLMDEMDKAKRAESMNKSYLESKGIKNVTIYDENKEDFVKGTLVLTEFLGKANGANISEIYDIFKFIYDFNGGSNLTELLSYRFAVFYDKSYHSRDPSNVDSAKFVMTLYSRVLDSGSNYKLHAIARLLTIWQDFTSLPVHLTAERKYLERSKRRTATKDDKVVNLIMGETMNAIFQQNDNYIFFSAFPQLVSNICHESEITFDVLKKMIVELMKEYPHECLWQIISSYRSKRGDRAEKTRRIFSSLYKSAPDMNFQELVKQYDFMANQLIVVAENTNLKSGSHRDFNKIFPAFKEFFKREKCKVSVPFITSVEKKMPTYLASQFVIPEELDNTIFITGFEDDFVTFSSLEKPKKLTMIGSDNVRYTLMAKKSDELRKDARCLDFCRTVNTLLLRNPETRRRQLRIRTYCVIPLQERGGIIEWVPNLMHMRMAVTNANSVHASHAEWNKFKHDPKARRKYFQRLCDQNPVLMAEYLRNNFPDPIKWYGARLAFTRTTATMSMVGFILGLGDRHCENILIDSTTGEMCHVDFNVLFNMGEDLPVPEKVPFRLTRNIVDGFGPTGVEGCFKKTCEVVMRLLREEQDMLCTVLQAFIHDPLLEFNKIEQRNQQMRHTKSNHQSDGTENKSRLEIDLIRSRLEGYIVTRKFHPLTKSTLPMSVEGQVAQLIKMATDFNTLADMFIGWNPHL